MARIGCLLLAICLLLCGCANKNGSPPTPAGTSAATQPPQSTHSEPEPTADSTSATDSTPEKEAEPEETLTWREVYAQAAVGTLNAGAGLGAHAVSLFYNYDEPPMLVMTYAYTEDDEGWRRFHRAWKYEDGEAVAVYEGEGSVQGVRPGTGNPVVFSQYAEGGTYRDDYTEHYIDRATPLLEFEYGNYGDDTLYRSLIDGSTWTAQEDPHGERFAEFFVRQVETLPLVYGFGDPGSAYADFDPTDKIRDFLGVSDWSPAVPADAPAWVGDYIALLHNYLFFSYYPEKAVNIADEGLTAGDWDTRWTGVKLLEPPRPGDAPILCGSFAALNDFGDDTKAIPLKNRMLLISDGPDDGYAFYKDEQGGYLIKRWAYTSALWEVIGEYDLEPLFRSGFSYLEEPHYAYLDDEYAEFGEDSGLAMEWAEEKVNDKLAELGYGELLDWPQAEIYLPEVAAWNEVESILIEEFCGYAKALGQM